jgi:Beta-lactamase superfamily domain
MKYASFLLVILIFTNCVNLHRGRIVKRDFVRSKQHFGKENATHHLDISYTGCGGYWIDYEGKILLLDPFFSNFTVRTLLTQPLHSDTTLIDAYFAKHLGTSKDTAGRVAAILVSHAHYDHIGDLASLLQRNLTPLSVSIFANRNTRNLMLPFSIPNLDTAAFLSIEQPFQADYQRHKNHPFPIQNQPNVKQYTLKQDNHIRITPIPSEHAGHFKLFGKGRKIPFLEGAINDNNTHIPSQAIDYKEGKNFNYLIDFLANDGQTILFRIFANNGAGCNAPIGFPPATLLSEKTIDLLLLCGANYNTVKDYPNALLAYTQPKAIFVNHWENFFKPLPPFGKNIETVPNTNIPKFLNMLQKQSNTAAIIVTLPLGEGVEFGF